MKSTPTNSDPGNNRAPRRRESMPRPKLIRDQQAWDHCLAQLKQEPRLAVDLEANSMFAYQERICLIQISTPTTDYIVDPLGVPDLSGLGAIMADATVEKVFHAAEYDLLLMTREHGWDLNNLFDTMWAARILGYAKLGLASLLEQFFDVKMSKRFQKSDWCRRPLEDAQLAYAQTDTHYLLELRDILDAELQRAGKQAEAAELFDDQTHARPTNSGFDPEGFWSLHGALDLSPQQRAVLSALYVYRDEEAQRRDVPHFKVFNDRTLMALAAAMPLTTADLMEVDGMARNRNQRQQRKLLEVIAEAREAEPPQRPKKTSRPSDSVLERYDTLHTWRKETARERGVESDVIMSRDALWALAQSNPQSLEEICDPGRSRPVAVGRICGQPLAGVRQFQLSEETLMTVTITFHGAARTVTGSQHLLSVNGFRILLDCGFFQGSRTETRERNQHLPFDAAAVDVMVLSHAHIDHSANIPNLVKSGFKGNIVCTSATRDLCTLMLRDSAKIQDYDIQYLNRKRERQQLPPLEPIYTMEEAVASLKSLCEYRLRAAVSAGPRHSVTFYDAGHLLGSAIVAIDITEASGEPAQRIVFSGDLGRPDRPILNDPVTLDRADTLILESTYGNREHPDGVEIDEDLKKIMLDTYRRGGQLIVPAFRCRPHARTCLPHQPHGRSARSAARTWASMWTVRWPSTLPAFIACILKPMTQKRPKCSCPTATTMSLAST